VPIAGRPAHARPVGVADHEPHGPWPTSSSILAAASRSKRITMRRQPMAARTPQRAHVSMIKRLLTNISRSDSNADLAPWLELAQAWWPEWASGARQVHEQADRTGGVRGEVRLEQRSDKPLWVGERPPRRPTSQATSKRCFREKADRHRPHFPGWGV
jgi:hypothetical protein